MLEILLLSCHSICVTNTDKFILVEQDVGIDILYSIVSHGSGIFPVCFFSLLHVVVSIGQLIPGMRQS